MPVNQSLGNTERGSAEERSEDREGVHKRSGLRFMATTEDHQAGHAKSSKRHGGRFG